MIGCLFVLLETVQINAEIKKRIDWVGEPNHAQPQDSPENIHPERGQRLYDDAKQAQNDLQSNDDEDDLQQRQQPIFGKGTYLEFQ